MLISAARVRPRREVSAPFDCLTSALYIAPLEFFILSLTVQKLFHVFHLAGISYEGPKSWEFLAILDPVP